MGTSVAEVPKLSSEQQAVAPTAETSSTAVAARERANVEARFIVAAKFPRDDEKARIKLIEACKRPRFAETARYSKPVGTKSIQGLSIRFAEEAARLWGNLAVDCNVVFDDPEKRIYRVTGTDLETNHTESIDIILEKTVERKSPKSSDAVVGNRINSRGEKVYLIEANEDALVTKVMANLSKARRNVILALVPGDVREECEEVVIATMASEDKADPDAARRRVLALFWKLGVEPSDVAKLAGVEKLEVLTAAQLSLLKTVYTAISEGEISLADAMAELGRNGEKGGRGEPKAKGADALKERLAKQKKPEPDTSEPAPAPADEPEDITDAEIVEMDRQQGRA